jgi:ribosomal protein S18 acetylase RimI-like enzyme
MHSLKTRFATIADAVLIADLSRETFYETFSAHNTAANMTKFMKEQFSRAALMKEVTEVQNIFFLAFDNKKPAGYAKMRVGEVPPFYKGKSCIEIARIYASRSYIGKGVGTALMRKCIQTATEKKNEIIWLGVWEKNQQAIDFYLRWGFEKFATHIFLLGDDPQTDWLMSKQLTRSG